MDYILNGEKVQKQYGFGDSTVHAFGNRRTKQFLYQRSRTEKSIRDYQGLWSKQKYKHDGIKLIL